MTWGLVAVCREWTRCRSHVRVVRIVGSPRWQNGGDGLLHVHWKSTQPNVPDSSRRECSVHKSAVRLRAT